jgi:preprotein translocase subunit YajC
MFTAIAYAAAGQPGGGGETGGMLGLMAPMLLMFAVFYFLLIRPQQKRTKQHRSMLSALQKGDHVLTTGGLLGRIVDVEGDILTVDIGETKVRVPRGFINGTYDPKALNTVSSQAPETK